MIRTVPLECWALIGAMTIGGAGIGVHFAWPAWACWLAGVLWGCNGLALAWPMRRM